MDEDAGMDDEDAGTDDEDAGMDDEDAGIDDEETGTSSEEVGTAEEVPTDASGVETGAEEVMIAKEDVCTDDVEEVTTGTVGVGVDEAGGTATFEDSAVTELDTEGVVERVQLFTSFTAPPWIGIRVMIQVCVTNPVGLRRKEKKLVIANNHTGKP